MQFLIFSNQEETPSLISLFMMVKMTGITMELEYPGKVHYNLYNCVNIAVLTYPDKYKRIFDVVFPPFFYVVFAKRTCHQDNERGPEHSSSDNHNTQNEGRSAKNIQQINLQHG